VFHGQADRPIFVGGLMRSGTSLTRVLLSQHRDIFGSFETHWFTDAVRLNWDDPASKRMQLLLSLLDIDNDAYRALCDRKAAEPDREFIDIVLDWCTTRAGKSRWVEKTPDNVRYWPLIQKQWPDAYFIHVTREYKDVFASWKTKRKETLDRFLASVQAAYADIRPLLGTTTGRYTEVDYADLVNDTEATMRRLLDFVGAPWDPACADLNLSRTSNERDHVAGVLGRPSPTAESLAQPIFSSGVGQWRDVVTDEEARRIESELAAYYAIYRQQWAAA
jgi:hypothetical protein